MGRKRRQWKLDGQMPRQPRCPLCRAEVLELVDPDKRMFECENHGWLEEKQMADYELVTTSLGEAWILGNVASLDETPALLASGLPFFTRDEWAIIMALPKDQRHTFWAPRVKACREECEMRAKNPKRTVYGDAPVAPTEAV